MDNVVPQAPQPDTSAPSPYTWQDSDASSQPKADAGPQVSQPVGGGDVAVPRDALAGKAGETPRAATIRRVATGVAGAGLLAAGAVVATKLLRGANAAAGANVIDFDD